MKKYSYKIDKDRQYEAMMRKRDWYLGNPMDSICFDFAVSGHKDRYNFIEKIEDSDKAVEDALSAITFMTEYYPDSDIYHCFNPYYLGEGMVPSMFGAQQYPVEDNPPYTKGRVISSLEEVPNLPRKINPENDGWGPKLKEACEKFLDAVNCDIPVGLCDVQSPYGVATKLIGNEDLMMGMYDEPELVHQLMDICTNAIIDTAEAMLKWTKGHMVLNLRAPHRDCGIILWDDYLSVLSPELHKEFCMPYIQRIFDHFGGLGHLHSCGPYFPRFYEAPLHCPGVRSVDLNIMSGQNKTRGDMIKFKKIMEEHNIRLVGSLKIQDTDIWDYKNATEPDAELYLIMCADRHMALSAGGSPEKGDAVKARLRKLGLLK